MHVFTATPAHAGLEEYDLAAQIATSRRYRLIDGPLKTFSSPHRYVLAVRTGPDGAPRRDDPARALERLALAALHGRKPEPNLGMAEGGVTR